VRRWSTFKSAIEKWTNNLLEIEYKHPNELSELEWKVHCERLLSAAGFSPLEAVQLLPMAIEVAQGLASDRLFR
jgi:hypothetical protein